MVKREYFYTVYERLWHWVQAFAMVALIITGFNISFPDVLIPGFFPWGVKLHNIVGILLVANAFLALFYNLTGGLIKRYVPHADDFVSMGFKHARYYLVGIFRGEPHPFEKTPAKRLLPLQKITYFMILNVLLPLMIITGILKLSAAYNPIILETAGGLGLIAEIHRFGAWLFLSFVILHVYMTTTGHTPLSSLYAMITGYEVIESNSKETASHETGS